MESGPRSFHAFARIDWRNRQAYRPPNGLDSRATSGYLGGIMRCVRLALIIVVLLGTAIPCVAEALKAPSWLPRYNIAINLDVDGHRALVTQHVAWVNRHQRPTCELVFNVHSAYEPPSGGIDYLFLAKMLEIMRVPPNEGIYAGRPIDIQKVWLLKRNGKAIEKVELPFAYRPDLATALSVQLPEEIGINGAVSIAIDFVFHIPQKQGRWGQWKGVTTLSNWLPVLAYYDEKGWQPAPFVAWHQPFFNEAGVYDVHLRLAADQKVGTSGSVRQKTTDGTQQDLYIGPIVSREFSLVCSARFEEQRAMAGNVAVICLAFPEHEHNAKAVARIAARAVEAYSKWFGPYANKELIFAESYFGWNGNECSGLVMVDQRVLNMPKLAEGYIEYLISHETCHQWFYNVIGTDGYRETFMDEAFANYFAHRLLNQVHGKNNELFSYGEGYKWLPNVRREDYRFSQLYGTIGRGELGPPLQEMPKYRHVVNLFSAAYDRGSKIVGMMEERMGEDAFLDFIRGIYAKYYFRVFFASDLQHELEQFTGKSWDEFFKHWLYDKGLTDWCLESAHVKKADHHLKGYSAEELPRPANGRYRVTVLLKQKAEFDEPTTLGFRFNDEETYPLRIPIVPQAGVMVIDDPPARIEALPDHRVRIEVWLPEKPTQITVDPDQILPDKNPANNYWKHEYRFHVTPLYTFLDETDLTTAYDRWNYTIGPWAYGPSYSDPWFTRTDILGVRAGAYRTQQFNGGVYTGYRTDYRDVAAGFDGLWTNGLFPKTEFGIHGEKSIATISTQSTDLDRFVAFERYVFDESASLYTAPMHYVEAFAAWQRNFLPTLRFAEPGTERFNETSQFGVHYHADYLTPYWDPQMGFKFDATYAAGLPIFGQPTMSHQVMSQLSWVHLLPEGLGYWSRMRLAYRMYGAYATPNNALMFSLGGNLLFRGFDLRKRQGNAMWIGSMEWRLPIVQDVEWDVADHAVGLRNLYFAPFYDGGDIYANHHQVGSIAQAVGLGLRAEVAWLSFIERTTIRIDFAKTINATSNLQVWMGIMQPF